MNFTAYLDEVTKRIRISGHDFKIDLNEVEWCKNHNHSPEKCANFLIDKYKR